MGVCVCVVLCVCCVCVCCLLCGVVCVLCVLCVVCVLWINWIASEFLRRRVIAEFIDDSSTPSSEVMTRNPKCVNPNDSGMDALAMMVEGHFRHLPVVDDQDQVVGVLDIAKCLFDVINRVEKMSSKSKGSTSSMNTAINSAVAGNMPANGNSQQLAALQALLGPLMQQMFGGDGIPTLRKLLADSGNKKPMVQSGISVRESAKVMAQYRKGVLVADGDELVGIFTPKDVLNRVVAKEMSADDTIVSSVMTPSPETVLPDVTVLECLHRMHDGRFLHLPVVEANGDMVGIVDVMDIVNSLMTGEAGRLFWEQAASYDDDCSETSSLHSVDTTAKSTRSARRVIKPSKKASTIPESRPVSKLRPKKPVIVTDDTTILEVAKAMADKRMDNALLISGSGGLSGILTDNDITRSQSSIHFYSTTIGFIHSLAHLPLFPSTYSYFIVCHLFTRSFLNSFLNSFFNSFTRCTRFPGVLLHKVWMKIRPQCSM